MNKKVSILLIILLPSFCFAAEPIESTKKNVFQRYIENIMPLTYIGIKGAVGMVCLGCGLCSWHDLIAASQKKIRTRANDYVISGFLVASGSYNIVQAGKDYRNV